MIRVNSWSPDTCGCIVLYSWDDAVPAEERVHSPVHEHKNQTTEEETKTKRCQHHDTPDIPDIIDLHECIRSENETKNAIYAHLLDDHPRLVRTRVENDNEIRELDPAAGFTFSFSGEGKNRRLQVELRGANLTPLEKNKIRDFAVNLKKEVVII